MLSHCRDNNVFVNYVSVLKFARNNFSVRHLKYFCTFTALNLTVIKGTNTHKTLPSRF